MVGHVFSMDFPSQYQVSIPLTHSLTHFLAHTITHHLFTYSLIHSFTHSLPHSLTHSLPHSLTHALTHSRTHSLTHSLTHSQNWELVDPADLFTAAVVSAPEGKGGIVQHLQREAAGMDFLVLWLDCDREGENICECVRVCV